MNLWVVHRSPDVFAAYGSLPSVRARPAREHRAARLASSAHEHCPAGESTPPGCRSPRPKGFSADGSCSAGESTPPRSTGPDVFSADGSSPAGAGDHRARHASRRARAASHPSRAHRPATHALLRRVSIAERKCVQACGQAGKRVQACGRTHAPLHHLAQGCPQPRSPPAPLAHAPARHRPARPHCPRPLGAAETQLSGPVQSNAVRLRPIVLPDRGPTAAPRTTSKEMDRARPSRCTSAAWPWCARRATMVEASEDTEEGKPARARSARALGAP